MKPPEPALVIRFACDLERLLGAPLGARRLALAVSGGPDSMAMLALAAAAFPGGVTAATVDHGFRAESANEAAMVATACGALGVPHAMLAIDTPPPAAGNRHAWARQQRYALLARWAETANADALATAHHADDQAETFLMRAARGSGVSGLAAVRAARPLAGTVLTLVRPLLGWRRSELRDVALTSGMPFVDDPSNTAERYERARVRRWLETADGIDPAAIARAAAHVAEAEADLDAIGRWLWAERAHPCASGEVAFDVAGLPRELRRRLARYAIACVRGGERLDEATASANVESLVDALESGKGATQAGVMATAKREIWHFREAPPRRSH